MSQSRREIFLAWHQPTWREVRVGGRIGAGFSRVFEGTRYADWPNLFPGLLRLSLSGCAGGDLGVFGRVLAVSRNKFDANNWAHLLRDAKGLDELNVAWCPDVSDQVLIDGVAGHHELRKINVIG